jgi:hypothetical protein
MLAVALYSAARVAVGLQQGRRVRYDVDIFHLVMATAMAGMLFPPLSVLDRGIWEAIFALATGWFACTAAWFAIARARQLPGPQGLRGTSHGLMHSVMGSAMLYMYLAPGTASFNMTAMAASGTVHPSSGAEWPPVLFLVVLLASAVLSLDRASRYGKLRPVAAGAQGRSLATEPSADPPSSGAQASYFQAGGALMAPHLEAACHLAMCLAMGYALVLMR